MVESGSESEALHKDPHLHSLEYLSMQLDDQTQILEWGAHALEVLTSVAVSSLNIAREQVGLARCKGRVDRGVGPEEPAPEPVAGMGALFEPEALEELEK